MRRRRVLQRVAVIAGLCATAGTAMASRPVSVANASTVRVASDAPVVEANRLRLELAVTRTELARTQAELDRWSRVFAYSARYGIGADLATTIYDVAVAERIEPELAFRLVRVESEFNPRATSSAGAVGLTQVMPSTAVYLEKGITRERLYDTQTNLRIGFRYLRGLVREHDGNLRLALLAYNRGPATVAASRRRGENPSNGYERAIMKGYAGRGVTD